MICLPSLYTLGSPLENFEEIVKRKPEVLNDDEDFDFKYSAYKKLEEHFNFDVIDNNRSLESVYPIVFKKIGLQGLK